MVGMGLGGFGARMIYGGGEGLCDMHYKRNTMTNSF